MPRCLVQSSLPASEASPRLIGQEPFAEFFREDSVALIDGKLVSRGRFATMASDSGHVHTGNFYN